MATWHANKPWGNLLPQMAYEIPTTPDVAHLASDTLYWLIWCITARGELQQADTERYDEIMATFQGEQPGPRKYAGIMGFVEQAKLNEIREWSELQDFTPDTDEDEYQSAASRYAIPEMY